jgi:hypothetical protein
VAFDGFTQAEECDVLVLDGVQSPPCSISSGNAPKKWDEQKAKDTSGDTIVFGGEGLGVFAVRFYAERSEHFATWAQFRPLIAKPVDGSNPTARAVTHPQLNEIGITACVVEDETIWLNSGKGQFYKDVKFKKWKPPTPAGGKPKSAAGGSAFEQAPKEDEYDKVIKDLTDQVKALT